MTQNIKRRINKTVQHKFPEWYWIFFWEILSESVWCAEKTSRLCCSPHGGEGWVNANMESVLEVITSVVFLQNTWKRDRVNAWMLFLCVLCFLKRSAFDRSTVTLPAPIMQQKNMRRAESCLLLRSSCQTLLHVLRHEGWDFTVTERGRPRLHQSLLPIIQLQSQCCSSRHLHCSWVWVRLHHRPHRHLRLFINMHGKSSPQEPVLNWGSHNILLQKVSRAFLVAKSQYLTKYNLLISSQDISSHLIKDTAS